MTSNRRFRIGRITVLAALLAGGITAFSLGKVPSGCSCQKDSGGAQSTPEHHFEESEDISVPKD